MPGGRLCGRAFTVQFLPSGPPDGRTPGGDIGHYMDDVPAGYVVAIDHRGDTGLGVWDDALTRQARERGIAGTVIDGASCESVQAAGAANPLRAMGAAKSNGKSLVRVEAFNLPIVIGGVRVECDDILLGDEGGLVVIPRDHLGPVLAQARELAAAKA